MNLGSLLNRMSAADRSNPRSARVQDEALESYRAALGHLQELKKAFPKDLVYASECLRAYFNMASLWSRDSNLKEVDEDYPKALAQFEKIYQEQSNVPEYKETMGNGLLGLGQTLLDRASL